MRSDLGPTAIRLNAYVSKRFTYRITKTNTLHLLYQLHI